MGRQRDYQRQRVYDWELRELRARLLPSWGSVELGDLPSVQRFLDGVCERERVSRVVVDVGTGNRRRGCCKGPNWIRIAQVAVASRTWEPWYLLHELAHCFDWRANGPYGESPAHNPGGWHGPRFVAYYADLLVAHLDVDRARLLGSLRGARIEVR